MAKRKEITPKKVVSRVDTLFTDIEREVLEAEFQTDTWRDKQEIWHKMRMRIKPIKTFPFPGCANIRLPTIETKLRKIKSQVAKIIFSVRPIIQAIPSPSGNMQTAAKVEKWLDHLIMNIIKFKEKAVIGIDQAIEKGFYLFKPHWRVDIIDRMEEYSIDDLSMGEVLKLYDVNTNEDMIGLAIAEKFDVDEDDLVADHNYKEIKKAIAEILQGKEKIKLQIKDVIYNYPDISLCNPEYVYVPSDSPHSPQECRMICQEFYIPYDTVKRNVEIKSWSQDAVDSIDIVKNLSMDNLTEISKETREGVDRLNNPSQLVKIWEVYTYHDLNGDGFDEKCLFTFAPDFRVTLRKITLPTNSGKFPFVKIYNELTDDRWFSHRGLPEIIEDLVKEIDTQHNQKIDNQTLKNCPMITYRAGIVNPNLIKFVPSQSIPRQDPDDVTFMQNTNVNADFSYKDEQMILESKIEELIGQVDFSLQSMINRRQPRTRGEVEMQMQNAQMTFSLDADLYIEAFSELFNQVWDLWCQYGNDEEEFAYFGQDGWEKIRLTKEEVQGKYKICVRGNDQNFNPMQRQQKAQMILEAVMSPVALQSGVVQPNNVYNAYKRFYQTLDEQNWQDYITDPSQLPPRQPPPAPVKINPENLTPAELAQVKASQGIQPDVQGMMLAKEQEMEEVENERSYREPANRT